MSNDTGIVPGKWNPHGDLYSSPEDEKLEGMVEDWKKKKHGNIDWEATKKVAEKGVQANDPKNCHLRG